MFYDITYCLTYKNSEFYYIINNIPPLKRPLLLSESKTIGTIEYKKYTAVFKNKLKLLFNFLTPISASRIFLLRLSTR